LATRRQRTAAGSRDIFCARDRIGSGAGRIYTKILGRFRILPELFLVFQISTGTFLKFPTFAPTFFSFFNFRPEKI
jgi:hypothetical protein